MSKTSGVRRYTYFKEWLQVFCRTRKYKPPTRPIVPMETADQTPQSSVEDY